MEVEDVRDDGEEEEEEDGGGEEDDDGGGGQRPGGSGPLEHKEASEEHNSSYVAQLHQVFLGCDTSGCGYLRKAELIDLCAQLHLEDQAGLIVDHLLGDEPDAKVDFDDFKDKFVFLLAQSVAENDSVGVPEDIVEVDTKGIHDANITYKSPEREVSPRYVWGSKKYGRRSRPELEQDVIDADFLLNSEFSDTEEVFLFDSNDDGLSSAGDDVESRHHLEPRSQEELRRSSWSHQQSHLDSLSSGQSPPSLYGSHQALPVAKCQPRQGAKRRRRMRSSEDRSSLDSESAEEQKESLNWMAEIGQQECPTNGNSGPNDEEYLQSIWMKLGVGSDGFLNKDGLIRVCEHIGMEKLSEDVISQLFEKLDVDQDGQISYDEFLHLFRNGEASSTTTTNINQTLDVKVSSTEGQRTTTSGVDPLTTVASSSSTATSFGNDIGIFHVISSECLRPGYAEPEVIVELWDSLGITTGYPILRHMGLGANSPVNLVTLTAALEEALQSPRKLSRDTEVCQAAIATYNQELKFLRKTIEQMAIEREKLRNDVAEANGRATLMAQEVDDHQIKLETNSQIKIANLEKKWQEQIRKLQEELESEREAFNNQITINKRNYEEEAANLKEAESRLREQMTLTQNENRNLEEEIRELNQRLSEAQKLNHHHQIEAETILAYTAEVTYEEQLREISLELESVRLENKQLKDNNDELSTELEHLRQQLMTTSNVTSRNVMSGGCCKENYLPPNEEDVGDMNHQQSIGRTQTNLQHRRNGSWLSDYIKDQNVSGGKRRGSGQQNSSTELEPMTMTGTASVALLNNGLASADGGGEKPNIITRWQACDFSDDEEEEYLQLNSQINGAPIESNNNDDIDRVVLSAFVNKMKLKNVFNILKQRFIEMYVEDVKSSQSQLNVDTGNSSDLEVTANNVMEVKHRLQRTNAVSDPDESFTFDACLLTPDASNGYKTSDSGVEVTPLSSDRTPTPSLNNIMNGENLWWNQSVESYDGDEDESQMTTLAMDHGSKSFIEQTQDHHQSAVECSWWKNTLERERASWRSAMRGMEEQCEEMRDSQARKEMAFKMGMLKNEVYWREQVEQERNELEQEKIDLQDKVLSLEFQLANSMKLLRERNVEKFTCQLDEESDDEHTKARKKMEQTFGNNYLGRSRSWKEYGTSCSNTDRRRRRWLKSKNNLEALDIEADALEAQHGDYKSDASDEDEDCNTSHKRLHEMKARPHHDKRMFEKLTSDRGAIPGTGKSNCVIDMNVLHSINQHLHQQEKRNRQLEATLKERSSQTDRQLRETRKSYEDEIQRVTQLLHRTRSFLKEQTLKVKVQGEKLFHSEDLVKELSWKNAELIKMVQSSEEKRSKSERLNYGLKQKCDALNQLVADMYRIQTT